MFKDLMLPSPRTLAQLQQMPDFVHPYHLAAERMKLQPGFAEVLATRQGLDDEQLALLRATKFLYIDGIDPTKDVQKIREILDSIRAGKNETNLKRLSITEKEKSEELFEITYKRDLLHAFDPVGFSFYAAVTTDDPRNALMEVETVLVRGRSRSEYLSGFRDLMGVGFRYFERNGIYVRHFNACWDPDYYGATNYKGYQDAVNKGKSPEEAAWSTRTGVILQSFGFNRVEVPPFNEREGINALFSR